MRRRWRNGYIEGNAEFFITLALIAGATIVGVIWAIAWATVSITEILA